MTEEIKPLTPEQYEILLSKNERVLWRMTQRHGKLCQLVGKVLWPKERELFGTETRKELERTLQQLGVDTDGC